MPLQYPCNPAATSRQSGPEKADLARGNIAVGLVVLESGSVADMHQLSAAGTPHPQPAHTGHPPACFVEEKGRLYRAIKHCAHPLSFENSSLPPRFAVQPREPRLQAHHQLTFPLLTTNSK
jgi:hypothetical protein